MTDLARALVSTVCYFDVRDVPITSTEAAVFIFRHKPEPLATIEKILTDLVLDHTLESHDGFYFLPGRAAIVEKRRQSGVYVEQKLQRARFGIWLLRFVPFIRAVFVCNSVAEERATEKSDIDLFIVAAPRRLWICRFFCTGILKLFRQRTSSKHENNRLCLSYFVTTEHLNLSDTAVVPVDVHLGAWVFRMIPLYDPKHLYSNFQNANRLARELFPSARQLYNNPSLLINDSRVSTAWRGLWEKMWHGAYGDTIEAETKKVQLPLLQRRLAAKMNLPDKAIIVSNTMIKLHEHDSRRAVYDAWLQKINTYAQR